MNASDWRELARQHRYKALELRAEALKLSNTARSEEYAEQGCLVNADTAERAERVAQTYAPGTVS